MSKTLKLNKDVAVTLSSEGRSPVYTADQLRAMLSALGEPVPPNEPGVQAVDADKSTLPSVDKRTSAPVQAPPNVHGSFTLNGIPVMASPIKADIDPRTGAPYIQPGPRPSTMISPPPSRRFDGR